MLLVVSAVVVLFSLFRGVVLGSVIVVDVFC